MRSDRLAEMWPDVTINEQAIPTRTVQSHAANLLASPDGDLLCTWFGGTQEGLHDIDIYLARLAQGDEEWSTPERMSCDPDRSEQNPVPFIAPDGALWLIWTAQDAGHQDRAEVRARISHDLGRSWGEQFTLFRPDEMGGVFVRQPPVFRSDGAWVVPVFRCGVVNGQPWSGDADHSAVRVSLDAGDTWSEVSVPDSLGMVHMCVVPAADGSFIALFRSRFADHVYRSTSDSSAVRWEPPTATDLPNNNSSIQAIASMRDEIAMVYNHCSAADAVQRRASLYDEIEGGAIRDPGESDPSAEAAGLAPESTSGDRRAYWGAPRAPLSLATSTDDGVTWTRLADLATGDGYCLTNNSRDGLNRELSYPTITRSDDGSLHVAYTHHRKEIRHIRVRAH